MKKSELLSLIEDIKDDEEIFFHPEPEMFIDDDLTCYGEPQKTKPEKEVRYLYDDGWQDESIIEEEFLSENGLDEIPQDGSFEIELGKYEKLEGYFIRVDSI